MLWQQQRRQKWRGTRSLAAGVVGPHARGDHPAAEADARGAGRPPSMFKGVVAVVAPWCSVVMIHVNAVVAPWFSVVMIIMISAGRRSAGRPTDGRNDAPL